MHRKSLLLRGLVLLLVMMILAACGSTSEPEAEEAPPATPETIVVVVTATEEPPTQTPVVIVVTATAEPETEAIDEGAEEPAATEEPEATAAATEVPASPTAVVPTCSTNGSLRLRTGPGEIYGIVRNLSAGTQMSPQAFQAAGFPAGSWLLVSVGGQQGWVGASPQFVTCNVNPAALPAPNAIPPTPTPIPSPTAIPPTPTPVEIAQLPITIGPPSNANNPDAGDFPKGRIEWQLQTDPDFLFRFFVKDTDVGDHDGAGIDSVLIQVKDQAGHVVDQRRENNAGYCLFGGGEPICNPWLIEDGLYKWRSTGLPVVDGSYELVITVDPKDNDDEWTWFLGDFPVNVP